ncbi:uncharacterized protein [Typha latifolia]|uniref:uncharacterized protein n=1 Tax=Typha latifolia TaxID=4733 RepID=UPI003C2F73BB
MEELPTSRIARRSKKPAARSAYDDVFGGPPRYAVPFAGRQDDYAEIFGDVASSCSIPFLDLPPAVMDGSDARVGNGVDYGEIFGGFDFEDFAVSTEELFGEGKREEIPSSNGRVSAKKGLNQQKIVSSDFPPEYPKGDGVPYSEEDQFSSHSYPSDEGVRQFNEPYNMTSQERRDDPVSRATYRAQPHTEATYVVDSGNPLQNIPQDNPPKASNGSMVNGEQGKTCPPRSSSDSAKSSGSDSKADWKEYKATDLTSANGHANVKNHNRSSSNHSASSNDVLSPDVPLLSVSEINLRTRPLRVPPPSRPPPKVLQNLEGLGVNTDATTVKLRNNHQTSFAASFSKSHSLQEASKSDSPYFFDVEVDVSSAAAASAAAMKEAMELAQARLKSAKELMERKRDSFQSRRNQGQGSNKYAKNKESQVTEEVEILKEAFSPEKLVKEHKIHDFMLEEKHKVIGAAKPAPYYHKEEQAPSSNDSRETIQRGSSRSSQASYNLEKSGKWKSDDEFYELTNNEEKYRTHIEVSEKEDIAEKAVMAKIIKDKENKNKSSEVGHEVEGNEKLWEGNERSKLDANYTELKVGNAPCSEEEFMDNPTAVLDASVHVESKQVEEVHDFQCEEGVRLGSNQENQYTETDINKTYSSQEVPSKLEEIKEMSNTMLDARVHEVNIRKVEEVNDPQCEEIDFQGTAEEALHSGEEIEKQYASDGPPEYRGSEKILEPSEASKYDGIHGSVKDESKLEVAEEAWEVEDSQKGSNLTGSLANKTAMQNECEKVNNGPGGSCLWEEEKLETTQVARHSDYCAKEKEMGQAECPQEENVVNLESTGLVYEQEEIEKLNFTEMESRSTENIAKVEATPKDVELEEDLDNLEAARWSGELEEKTEATADTFMSNYNGKEAKGALSEDKHKKGAEKEPPKQESYVEQIVPPNEYEKERNEELTEGKVTLDFREEEKVDAATNICRMAVNTNLDDQQATFLEKRVLRSAQDIASSCTVTSQKFNSGIRRTEEKNNGKKIEREQEQEKERMRKREDEKERERKILREREQEKERARKLEEEKEREREREKDRLAVERATREAHERAFAEARERAEKIAMERVVAARQRASAEAREKSEKISAEDVEKSLAEKAAREARLRAERAAVERATAEARERAIEKAMAEKAAVDARERMERFNSSFKEHSRGSDQDVQQVPQFQKASSSNSQNYRDSSNQGDGESALRCKARLERHQRTVERAAKALAEKNMRDMLAQREQAEKHRLAEYLDADIRRWSNGKEGNLRALLSTLQYILGPESGWQPVPLTDVITATAVKKAYRKATLCVHPDKLQQRGASIQQKYICEKVFDLLKEAWNRFNSEER